VPKHLLNQRLSCSVSIQASKRCLVQPFIGCLKNSNCSQLTRSMNTLTTGIRCSSPSQTRNQSFVILIPDITKYVTTMCSRSSLIVSSRIYLFFHVNRPFPVLPDIQSLLDHLFSHTICLIPSVPYLSPTILPSSLSHFTDIPFNAAY
jgi:hypothetical protein